MSINSKISGIMQTRVMKQFYETHSKNLPLKSAKANQPQISSTQSRMVNKKRTRG